MHQERLWGCQCGRCYIQQEPDARPWSIGKWNSEEVWGARTEVQGSLE